GRLETDRWLLVGTLLLVGGGLAMVLSASQALGVRYHNFPLYYFLRQAALALAGLALLLGLRRVDYHRLHTVAPVLAVLAAALMLVVVLPGIGLTIQGARR